MKRLGSKDFNALGFKDQFEAYVFLEKIYQKNKTEVEFLDAIYLCDIIRDNLEVKEDVPLPNPLPEDILKGINFARIKRKDISALLEILETIAVKNKLTYKKIILNAENLDLKKLKKSKILKAPFVTYDKKSIHTIPFLIESIYREV